jgi:hypothetical protein
MFWLQDAMMKLTNWPDLRQYAKYPDQEPE